MPRSQPDDSAPSSAAVPAFERAPGTLPTARVTLRVPRALLDGRTRFPHCLHCGSSRAVAPRVHLLRVHSWVRPLVFLLAAGVCAVAATLLNPWMPLALFGVVLWALVRGGAVKAWIPLCVGCSRKYAISRHARVWAGIWTVLLAPALAWQLVQTGAVTVASMLGGVAVGLLPALATELFTRRTRIACVALDSSHVTLVVPASWKVWLSHTRDAR